MNKQEAISRLSEITEESKVESEKHLEAFLQLLGECAENKEQLKLVGYFTMSVKERASRVGHNPQTKEKIQIPAKNAISMKIGSKLKNLAL